MNSEIIFFLSLAQIPLVNSSFGKLLRANFANTQELLSLTKREWELLGAPQIIVEKITAPNWEWIKTQLAWAEKPGQHLLTIFDARYPTLLHEIKNPPLMLFVAGDPELLASPQLAIVGSRKPTPVGKATAFAFAKELAALGFTITSGLALGIDVASHSGALAAAKPTIAVMGTGQDTIYPRAHSKIAAEIVAKGGAVVSEYPLGTAANALHFPQRNRIISGLSFGTLVVEASLHSGSLITARCATEQGREVFAIPGSIHNQQTRGCHSLIRNGAKLVENTTDIIEEIVNFTAIPPQQTGQEPTAAMQKQIFATTKNLDNKRKLLLECIGDEVTAIEVIAERSKLPLKEIFSILFNLEVSGLINSVLGGYQRVK